MRNKHSIEKIIVLLILATGVFLSLVQFLFNRSLWLDESMLALNIINKDSLELLKPLAYDQVAPILFLQIEKLFSLLLPHSEQGLRLFPLLCYWTSIWFFYKIIKKQLHNTYAVVFALSVFVFNPTFIYYSSEVKQYMSDMFVLLAVFYFVLKDYDTDKNRYYVLALAGIIAIGLSNVAPILLSTCGLYLLYEHFFVLKKDKILPLFIVFAAWLCVFGVYYAFFIYDHPTQQFMVTFWSYYGCFLPHNSIKHFFDFIVEKNYLVLDTLSPLKFVTHSFLLVGIIYLVWKKKFPLLILTCTPLLLHLFLSTFRLYPFFSRLLLYTLPCLIIICSVGFDYILKLVFAGLKIERFRLLLVAIPVLFLFFIHLPVKREEIKHSIRFIQENIAGDESVYVHYFATFPYKYYDNTGFSKIKAKIIEGQYTKAPLFEGKSVIDWDNLSGKNWFLFIDSGGDETFIINRLDSLGYKRIKAFKTDGSAAYLFDFEK